MNNNGFYLAFKTGNKLKAFICYLTQMATVVSSRQGLKISVKTTVIFQISQSGNKSLALLVLHESVSVMLS